MLIAQLTDSHIKPGGRLAYKRVDTSGCLQAAIQHVNAMTPKVDAVIVTGDMTDRGSPDEFDYCRDLLDKLDAPYFVVPGNHDSRAGLKHAWGKESWLQDCGDFIQFVVDDFPVCLIGLDSTTDGQPFGSFCQDRIDWLDRELSARPDRDVLLFMHHPPFLTGIGHMDRQCLLEADRFLDLLKRHSNIRHVACGHVHRACETTINGVGISIAPNAAHSVTLDLDPDAPSSFTMDPLAIRLFYSLGPGALVSHVSYLGDFDGPHPFYEPGGALID